METVIDSTEERIPNRYSLVVLAAKRARQIKEGAPPLVHCESANPLTVALEEIAAGKINYIEAPLEEDDEVLHREEVVAPPAVPMPPTAMQMLTESLELAERAAAEGDEGEGAEIPLGLAGDAVLDGQTEETEPTEEIDGLTANLGSASETLDEQASAETDMDGYAGNPTATEEPGTEGE